MPSCEEVLNILDTERARQELFRLYLGRSAEVSQQARRFADLVSEYKGYFPTSCDSVRLFSAPGRVEVGGNHTDHSHGRVLAAAVNLDAVAVASRSPDRPITIFSEGYPEPFVLDTDDLYRKEEESGSSLALIRGLCRAFRDKGYSTGGFNAWVSSDVAVGSGLSSSAAFEVLIGTILNSLYNDGKVSPEDVALAGQYAENEYFGKPSGLMDQMTSAVGGLVTIDFADPAHPSVKKVDFEFGSSGFDVVVVNTGGSHADLTQHYSSVAQEMRAVANALGADALRGASAAELMKAVQKLRRTVGDRALLRAIHFFADNERVALQVDALGKADFERFLRLVNDSGRSSWMLLQNVYAPERPEEQSLSLALALTEQILDERGACRVHGGGFAGTILSFVPGDVAAKYVAKMDDVFGGGAARILRIRPVGACEMLSSNIISPGEE